MQDQGLTFPRCVVLIEGDEESGSGHLFYYIDKIKEKIGDPVLFFCLDSGTLDYDRFWMTRSLRGNLTTILTVEVLKEGIHSEASGVVPSTFRILRQLLDRIECSKTG
jgi:acetylornithine deacetylase/succinyl-diaminopimelate desuccinylase-like protein